MRSVEQVGHGHSFLLPGFYVLVSFYHIAPQLGAMHLDATLHSLYVCNCAPQAGSTLLIPVYCGADPMKLISFAPSAPAMYSVFDPETLQSEMFEFNDTLKLDFSSLYPSLDIDGSSYNSCVGLKGFIFAPSKLLDPHSKCGPCAGRVGGLARILSAGPVHKKRVGVGGGISRKNGEQEGACQADALAGPGQAADPHSPRCRPLCPAVLGVSIGAGILVYRVVKSGDGRGLAGVVVGRSRMRNVTTPSFLSCLGSSLNFIVIPEMPAYLVLPAYFGVAAFDSDGESPSSADPRSCYFLQWVPKVCLDSRGTQNGTAGKYHLNHLL